MQRQARIREKSWGDTHATADRKITSPGRVVKKAARVPSSAFSGTKKITGRGKNRGTSAILTAELIGAFGIIALRVLGDYQVTDGGVAKGTLNTPGNGGFGPFTVAAGLIGMFFLLSFPAAKGGTSGRLAIAAGLLIDVVLLYHSKDEISAVAKFLTANPATRTVEAADWNSGASQSWGAAAAISSASTGSVTLASYDTTGGPGYFTSPVGASGFQLASVSSQTSTSPGAGTGGTGSGTGSATGTGLGAQIAADAKKLLGDPYVYGGTSPSGFDCSGLVQYVLNELGVTAPRTSEEQYSWATPVSSADLAPGDLVFAQFPGDNASPGHVGIYLGGGEVLSAEDPSLGVGTSTLASWAGNIVGYGAPPSSGSSAPTAA
jgi:cell wall-associated NlpC family hydrolase